MANSENPEEAYWMKKARKILDIAELELQERVTVEQFGLMCNQQTFQNFLDEQENPFKFTENKQS